MRLRFSPSYRRNIGGADDYDDILQSVPLKKAKVDWSYGSRKKMAMLKCASNPSQKKITNYFDLVDKIDLLSKSNDELMKAFNEANKDRKSVLGENERVDFKSFFNQIVVNAEQNATKHPQGRRHSEGVKKFATSLFLYAGSMAYNLIHKNMPTALPSLRTVQEAIHSQYHRISEGQFQFDELATFLNKYKAPSVIAISEDATRLLSRVEFDIESNRLVGFVLPCDSNGLPIVDSFLALSFECIEQHFKQQQVAKLAYVFMAQCVCKNVPPFCLGCIGTDNCFTATEVLKRWKYIYSECQKRNITVVSF